jgi:hypothetical protein
VSNTPFLNHLISGVGEPFASHFNVNGLFLLSTLPRGCSIIAGASRPKKTTTQKEEGKKRKRKLH